MKDIIEILKKNGGMLSSDLSAELKSKGFSEDAARQKISRAVASSKSPISRLPNLKFPHQARFYYLKDERDDNRFYVNLTSQIV